MHNHTLTQLREAINKGEISSEELTKHYLTRIRKADSNLNAFITVTEELALAAAKKADQQKDNRPLLHGLPIAHKDIFCTKGIKTSCGSKMLDNFIAPYDATVVERFTASGAILLGKTNMDEFAMGSSNETSYYGPTRNPWDLNTVPGGSSGGSAAVVAARLAPASTGTDTGGSIRQPAALCGITGLKPTYGRVSRFGMIAFASSLDQGGPFAQTAEDCALLLEAMAGFDPKDSTSIDKPVPHYQQSLHDSLEGLTMGLPKEFFGEGLDPTVEQSLQETIKTFEKLGVKIKEISLPHTHLAVPTYYVIAPAECSSNLARYDGVRFGFRHPNPKNLEDLYKQTRTQGFGDEVKRRILMGTYVLSSGYYDAYYLKAQQVRQLIANDFKEAFKDVDFIIGPTTPTPAFPIGEKADPISMYLCDLYTININLAGLPALSMPAGLKGKLPIGVQLIGNHFEEARLLNAAHQFQQNTNWHQQTPEAFRGDIA